MAASSTRELAPAQQFPQTAGLAVSLLGTIADCIEPSEADILIDPLRELAESFALAIPGSLFSEWAPPRKPLEEEVELHRAQAFAESCKDKDKYPPAAALGADTESKWVSSDSADPSKWTLKLPGPTAALHAVSVEFATSESISKPGKVTVETSSDGFKFKAVGKPSTIGDDDEDDGDGGDGDDGDEAENPFKLNAASSEEASDALRVSIPPSRKVQFLRITMEGKAGKTSFSGSCKHGITRVRLLRVRADPLRTSTAQVLSTLVRACSVAGAKDAPAPARVAAIEALLAVAAATSSTQAATLAMAITSQHLASGGDSLPGSVASALGPVVRAATAASIESLTLAATSGHAPSIAAALEPVKGMGGGESTPAEPKFDPRNHGDNCDIRNGGRLWHSTGSSDNWAMAKTGIKKPMIATWEFEVTDDERSDEQTCLGFSRKSVSNGSYQSSSDLWMVRCYNGQLYNDGSGHSSVDNIHPGDVVRFRANMKRGTVELWVNGSKQNDGDPIFTGITGTIHPAVCGYSGGKETKFRSYKIEGAAGEGDGVPVLASSHSALLDAIKATKGASAPFVGSSAGTAGVVVDGTPRRAVAVLRADGTKDTDFGKKRGDDDDEDDDDDEVPGEVAAALPPAVAGEVCLQFVAKEAISGLKKKPAADAEVRSFTASFSVAPTAPADVSAACSVAEVLVNDRVRWRSAPLHASPELSGTAANPLMPQTCTVTAGLEDAVRVVVRMGASGAAHAAASGAGAGGDDAASKITPVVMSGASFGMGTKGASLKAFLPDPSDAVDAVFAGSHAASIGAAVSPLLCQGGGFRPDGFPVATVPTAQFLAELTAALTACAQAEAALTKAAVACVGVGGSRVTPEELKDADGDADAEDSDKDKAGSSGPSGSAKAALLARLFCLEAPLSLETSDAAVQALAEGLEVALALPLPNAARDRVALTLTAQATVLLGRVSGSGLPARSLGLTLPSSTAKAPAASAAAVGRGRGARKAASTPLDRLRVALDGFEATKIAADLPLAAASALSAADAGTGLFYPTKALRDELLSRLLAGGATFELQVRFPSLSRAVADTTLAGLPAKVREAVVAWPAEAHPSMRDSRFDRLVTLVQAAASSTGLRCEVRGRWGGWLHLLVALPEAGATAAAAGSTTPPAQFVSTAIAGCMKRAGMGTWRFPGGCSDPVIGVEVRRSRVVSEQDRRFTVAGQAVVRLFPAAAGSFDDIVGDVDAEVAAFDARLASRNDAKDGDSAEAAGGASSDGADSDGADSGGAGSDGAGSEGAGSGESDAESESGSDASSMSGSDSSGTSDSGPGRRRIRIGQRRGQRRSRSPVLTRMRS